MNIQSIKSDWQSYAVALLLLGGTFATYWTTRPFADVVASKTVEIGDLSKAQRMNITLAAKFLDGATIKPGEQFSFNKLIGPRTERRGYLGAPSYVGPDTPSTTGGGICLLSSCTYQLALESGMAIDKRTAHLRTIKTVAPGLDATVWYGQSDLTFTNKTKSPIQFHAFQDGPNLKVQLLGTRSDTHVCTLRTYQQRNDRDHLRVRVVRSGMGRDEVISDDLYGLPRGQVTAQVVPSRVASRD
ncbi:MAG: VanW family protein [Candidatus Melainabacteria bacterium]|nr:VanW family protein [Candidatus Melainabacteria bacterium]